MVSKQAPPSCKASFVGLCNVELKQVKTWSASHACEKMPRYTAEEVLTGKAGVAPAYFWEVSIRPNTIGYNAEVRCCYCGEKKSIGHNHD